MAALKQIPRGWWALLGALLLAGAAAFLYGATRPDSLRAWQAYLVNFLFWSGMAQAGVVLAAVLHLSNARWPGPVKRLAEGGVAFLPVSFLLFLPLYFGREALFSWVREPLPAKSAWLNFPFLFGRDLAGLLLVYGLSALFVRSSLRAESSAGPDEEPEGTRRRQTVRAIALLLAYAVVFSLLAFDLVMSLAPHWYSTLFGGYFFIGNLYLGLAGLVVVTALARRGLRLEAHLSLPRFHDLGKLVFAFCLLWTYLFWSQYLVIWYGDVPEETSFLFTRVERALWSPLSWLVLGLCFLVPFVVLLSREAKRRPTSLVVICAIVLVGMWWERYVLVVPSVWQKDWLPFGPLEVLITLGFLAAAALSYLAFLRRVPLIHGSES